MALGVETIGIHDFKPTKDGKVIVSLNNGNMGAFICDEATAEKLKEKYRAELDTFELAPKNEDSVENYTALDKYKKMMNDFSESLSKDGKVMSNSDAALRTAIYLGLDPFAGAAAFILDKDLAATYKNIRANNLKKEQA